MKLSEIKTAIALADCQAREFIESFDADNDDFTVNDWRFISAEVIDRILADELEGDEYILGCFTAWAIADATDWPIALIEAAQAGEAYEKIGEALTREHIEALADCLARHDGYGHHFNHYDGETYELTLDGRSFYAFQN